MYRGQKSSLRYHSETGFTLVELIMGASLVIIIGYGMATLMDNLFKSSKAVNQNSERLQLLDEVRHHLQTQDICDFNFRGLNPNSSNTISTLRYKQASGSVETILDTSSNVTYGGGSIRITSMTFGNFVLQPSADKLNGVANLTIKVERVGTKGDQYGGETKPFDIPIAVRLVPAGTPGPPSPGTVDHCRLGTGGISVTNLFNVDDAFPATPPPVGANLKTAYAPDYNIALGKPEPELYNMRLRTEGGDILAKDGNLYISRDASPCTKRKCSNNNKAGAPNCVSNASCGGSAMCVLSWVECPSSQPPGNNLLKATDGDLIVGFGEYTRMASTFGTGPGGLGFNTDQMFLVGWDSPSGNVGVAMPENQIFKIFGAQAGGAPGTYTRASLAASGNVYSNYGDVVGMNAAYKGAKANTSLIGFGNFETMVDDANRYGVSPDTIFGVGWSDGTLTGDNKIRTGVVMPEGWNGYSIFKIQIKWEE